MFVHFLFHNDSGFLFPRHCDEPLWLITVKWMYDVIDRTINELLSSVRQILTHLRFIISVVTGWAGCFSSSFINTAKQMWCFSLFSVAVNWKKNIFYLFILFMFLKTVISVIFIIIFLSVSGWDSLKWDWPVTYILLFFMILITLPKYRKDKLKQFYCVLVGVEGFPAPLVEDVLNILGNVAINKTSSSSSRAPEQLILEIQAFYMTATVHRAAPPPPVLSLARCPPRSPRPQLCYSTADGIGCSRCWARRNRGTLGN